MLEAFLSFKPANDINQFMFWRVNLIRIFNFTGSQINHSTWLEYAACLTCIDFTIKAACIWLLLYKLIA